MKDITLVIPAYNEGEIIAKNIDILVHFLKESRYQFDIVIVENGSDDNTYEEALRIKAVYPEIIQVIHLDQPGKGGAVRAGWESRNTKYVGYMDVDLSMSLQTFFLLMKELEEDDFDIAIASRYLKDSNMRLCFKRRVLSYAYKAMLNVVFHNGITDYSCGFKIMKNSVAKEIFPNVKNNNFFFDTEMLIIASKRGYRVSEVPVQLIERSDSKVRIIPTVIEYINGLLRMRFK